MTRKKKTGGSRYHGYRTYEPNLFDGEVKARRIDVEVTFNGTVWPLPLCLEIRNHSPCGFNWGYGGSGPAQLALALVYDACGVEYAIPAIYQRFKFRVVSRLPEDGWVLTGDEIRDEVAKITAELDAEGIADVFPPDEGGGD